MIVVNRCEPAPSPARRKIIENSLSGSSPEEKAYLRDYVRRTGLAELFPPLPWPADHFPADYEGAILARQEQFYV